MIRISSGRRWSQFLVAKSKNSITLVEGTKIILSHGELVKTFNVFFVSIVKSLGINENFLPISSSETRNVESTIAKFENYPSIVTIRNRFDENSIFSFKEIGKTEVIKEIKNLDIKKGSLSSDIPTKIIRIWWFIRNKNFNLCLNEDFPEILKIAQVTPIYKKANPFEKDNYRPIRNLSNISKIFAIIMHNQMNNFFINKLSKYQCGFRKGFGTQHCLLVMIEKLRKIQDINGFCSNIWVYSHELLMAKLNAYGFDIKSLNFILAYFTNRKQKTKIGSSFSDFLNIFLVFHKVQYSVFFF